MWWRWTGIVLLGLSLCSLASAEQFLLGDILGGGFLGDIFAKIGTYYLHPVGGGLLWVFITLIGMQLTIGGTWAGLVKRVGGHATDLGLKHKERSARRALAKEAKREEKVEKQQDFFEKETVPLYVGSEEAEIIPKFAVGEFAVETSGEQKGKVSDAASKIENITDATSVSPFEPDLPERIDASILEVTPDNFTTDLGADNPVIDDRIENAEAEDILAPLDVPTKQATVTQSKSRKFGKARLPKLDLLTDHSGDISRTPREELEQKGRNLMECLADFSIKGELQRITPGPVVTMFEVKPAPGIKVSKIAGLADDLAMALKALSVRIQAPIPGKDSVGIEIPNENREVVCLRELLSSKAFKGAEGLLTLGLGKDIAGIPGVADLAKMPHLLVAGATGQGKSVFINSVLMSLLYKAKPEDLKLLLVDPKRIELAVYADLPHLVHPVVTDMSQAKNALDWAVHEMDQRYDAMAKLGVRNILSFNEKLIQMGEDRPPELAELEVMPYMVIIIDELADLMLTAAKEVETSIVRLAQLARACGIHLILATQRPSVDVVTGLIKANFPCRVSFQVTAKHDSRTILDAVGAEMLLGKGDMLFKPGGGKLQRMHGAFVADEDVASVVNYWRAQQPPAYKVDFAEWGNEGTNSELSGPSGGGEGIPDDPVYQEAVQFVMQQGKASISLIQRRFRIGFNRAARYVEQMEQDGIIGPADGSKPRTVIAGQVSE